MVYMYTVSICVCIYVHSCMDSVLKYCFGQAQCFLNNVLRRLRDTPSTMDSGHRKTNTGSPAPLLTQEMQTFLVTPRASTPHLRSTSSAHRASRVRLAVTLCALEVHSHRLDKFGARRSFFYHTQMAFDKNKAVLLQQSQVRAGW